MSENTESQHSPDAGVGAEPGRREGLQSWRNVRRWFFVLACLATLIGLFYAVEDWRGKRAWEKCRRELEAQGAVLDWNAFIPAPVPDEQNIFKAPRMTEWFVRESWTEAFGREPTKRGDAKAPFTLAPFPKAQDVSVLVAEVAVVPSNAPLPPGKGDAVLRFDEPAAREQAAKLLRERIGPCADGATGQGLIARPVDQINPVCLVVQADTVPNTKALADFFSPPLMHFAVAPAGSNAFRVSLNYRVWLATDYLAASAPAVADLDLLRQALERPCARMDSDYQRPFERPIPNFVRLRTVAQMLAQRAQCYLLLGQPEAAWHELAMVRGVCHMLEAKPANDSPTLVEAMIDVAITGLYTSIIQDGLRRRVWREPELVAMQQQLADIHLLPLVREAFNTERAATCRTFETTPSAELKKLFSYGTGQRGVWEELTDPTFLLLTFAPRGWLYQNMCVGAPLEQKILEGFHVANDRVLPSKFETIAREVDTAAWHRSPFSFLAAAALPNFVKASQTMARNQTLANEAFIACGLERYRLAHGQYPETLEALVPQFAAKLPHDLIGGQALMYRRAAGGRFVLCSIGWNEREDGGVARAAGEGGWVWQ